MNKLLVQTSLLIVVVCSIISCSQSKHGAVEGNGIKQSIAQEKETLHKFGTKEFFDSLSLRWREDTCGCKWDRSYDVAMELIKHYKLQGKDTIQVYEVLGPPNNASRDDEDIIWTYYLQGIQLEKCYPRESRSLDFDSLGILRYHPDGYLVALHD